MLNFQKMLNILILQIGIIRITGGEVGFLLLLLLFCVGFFSLKVSGNDFQEYENVATLVIISVTNRHTVRCYFFNISIFVNYVYTLLKNPPAFVASILLDLV